VTLPEGFEKGHEDPKVVDANSGRKGVKVGIGIAVVLGILYAAVFAVDYTKGQSSPLPENLQNVEVDRNTQGSQEDTTLPDTQENTNQPSSSPQLFADISFAKNPIGRGDVQTITVTVFDGGYKLYRAPVDGTVTYASGTQKHFGGTTDAGGQVVYSWEIESNSAPGIFSVDVNVSSGGQSISKHSSFEVTAS
jgi:hypothetical protein